MDEAEVRRRLQESLSKSTPFTMRITFFDGVEWLMIFVAAEDAPNYAEADIHTHNWDARVIHSETKWLFLNVGFEQKFEHWSFAFNLNSPTVLSFLRRMLRTKRVYIGFRNNMGFRLDPNPADSLVEDFGEKKLSILIPGWRHAYRAKT